MSTDVTSLRGLDAKAAFGEAMGAIAEQDELLSVVVSDYGRRLNLERMREVLPQAFVECGIAEQSQVELAAALANEGFHVFAPSYATFITARVTDQVRVMLGMMRSPVVLVGVCAGCESAMLGASHMALEDLAYMRTIPGMTVICPADNDELVAVLRELAGDPRPAYVRMSQYDRDVCLHPGGSWAGIGHAELLHEAPGARVALLATGALTSEALRAAEVLEGEGTQARVVEFATVSPLDTVALDELAGSGVELVVTVEDHNVAGGFGSAVAEHLASVTGSPRVLRLGTPADAYQKADLPRLLLERLGLTAEGIAASVREALV